MTKVKIYAILFNSVFLILVASITLMSSQTKQDDQTKYIYLVRHAEKDLTDSTNNPPLTPQGEARAQRLVDEFASLYLDQIFSTPYERNMNTVEPLAKSKKLAIETYEWKEYKGLIKKIKEGTASSVLMCGHGDNLIPMIKLLGGKSPLEELGHAEYDKLFKITYHPKKTKVKMWTY